MYMCVQIQDLILYSILKSYLIKVPYTASNMATVWSELCRRPSLYEKSPYNRYKMAAGIIPYNTAIMTVID